MSYSFAKWWDSVINVFFAGESPPITFDEIPVDGEADKPGYTQAPYRPDPFGYQDPNFGLEDTQEDYDDYDEYDEERDYSDWLFEVFPVEEREYDDCDDADEPCDED